MVRFTLYIPLALAFFMAGSPLQAISFAEEERRILALPENKVIAKLGERAKRENLTYKIAFDLGLRDAVAPNALVNPRKIVEEKIMFLPENVELSKLSPEMQEFVKIFKPKDNTLTLGQLHGRFEYLENKEKEKFNKFIATHFDIDNIHKLFLFQTIIQNADFATRNIMVTLTNNNKIKLIAIDNENAFNHDPGRGFNNSIVGLPPALNALAPSLISLVKNFPTIVKKYEKEIEKFDVQPPMYNGIPLGPGAKVYNPMILRTQALANYLEDYPTHNLRQIHAFAFLSLNSALAAKNIESLSLDFVKINFSGQEDMFWENRNMYLQIYPQVLRMAFFRKDAYDLSSNVEQDPKSLPSIEEMLDFFVEDDSVDKVLQENKFIVDIFPKKFVELFEN